MTVSLQDFMGDIEGNTKPLTEADEEVLEQEKQDRLKDEECYSKASNSRVDYYKSVAFPLSGQSLSLSDTFHRRIQQLQFQWFDANSPSYLRYLGYLLWFNTTQRDTFCKTAAITPPKFQFCDWRSGPGVYQGYIWLILFTWLHAGATFDQTDLLSDQEESGNHNVDSETW
ncbi:hypothetical protein CU098_013057, partial [Rhizopus stolonifer]